MEEEAYLDANVFLYALLDTGAKGKRAAEILQRVKDGASGGATSALTFDEVFWKIKKQRSHQDAIRAAEAFLLFPNLRVIAVTPGVLSAALELLKKHDLGPRDAIHAACAAAAGIRTMVSDDADFDRIPTLKRKPIL
ncbi:MAG: type II toxin-antitoxin system VapC family toxin [Candidatus Aenigmarchaeota archaeon]|nr:type II toxin-antitoxin system VapC family toxin [Candidatus Aenigmarchaeota archaeon]